MEHLINLALFPFTSLSILIVFPFCCSFFSALLRFISDIMHLRFKGVSC